MLIGHLFWEQSEGWVTIAHDHIDKVAATCKTFLLQILDHTAAPEIKSRLLSLTVLPALKCALEAALNELKDIEKDKQRHPITYNHYFTDTVQKLQQKRLLCSVEKLAEEATVKVDEKTWMGGPEYETKRFIHPDRFHKRLPKVIERDMDKFSAEQALDAHDVYYKVCI